MTHVFLATDHNLDRRVVIKVLRDDVAVELSAERFAREIRLAARLELWVGDGFNRPLHRRACGRFRCAGGARSGARSHVIRGA
jgi:hypothetical protein